MIKPYSLWLGVVILLHLACNSNKKVNNEEISNDDVFSASITVAPKLIKLIKDSVRPVLAKGTLMKTDLVRPPTSRKFVLPNLNPTPEKEKRTPIFSRKIVISDSQLEKHIPGKNGAESPIKVIIPDNGPYKLANGVMIYPPIVVQKIEKEPIKAAPAIYNENISQDLQFLDESSGMPSTSVLTMMEDSRGIIWIGTLQGLIKYDGVTFVQYNTDNGLINNVVNSLFEDKKGNIWVGTSVGVTCYNGRSFVHYTEAQGLADNEITSIIEDNKGNIWIGTRNGISLFDGNSFMQYTTKQGLVSNEISSILLDKSDNIWIGTGNGICRYNDGNFIHYPTGPNNEINSISVLKEDNSGRIWFATWDGGLSCLNKNKLTTYLGNSNQNSLTILSIHQDTEGRFWLGTFGQGVVCFDENKFVQYTTNEGLVHNSVNSVIEDSSGKLWLGTLAGINCFQTNSFTSFTKRLKLTDSQVISIGEGSNNELVVGTSDGIVLLAKDSTISAQLSDETGDISSVLKDKKGRIWFGSESGLYCYSNGVLSNYKTKQGLINNWVSDIKEDKHGNLWIATWGGVSFYNDAVFVNYTKRSGLGGNSVSSVLIDNTGKIWFGLMGGGISCLDGDSITNYGSSNGLGADKITSIVQDKSGNIWFGSYGEGLFCYNGTTFFNFTTQHGLSNNFIESLIVDEKNRLWLAGLDGINLLTCQNKSARFQLSDEFCFYNFGPRDGLKSKKFGLNAVFLDQQNQLWWGGQNGLVKLDLGKFSIPKLKPKLQLSTLEIQQQFIDYGQLHNKNPLEQNKIGPITSKKQEIKFSAFSKFNNYPVNLELNYRFNQLIFSFVAIDWQAPHKLKYQYALKGFDESWSELSSSNKAIYKNLPPGDYSLKVRAIGVAKKWSNTLVYSFVIYPPWWLTWWAKVSYVLLFIALVGAYIRLRIASLKKSKKILEQKVRERTIVVETQKEELLSQNKEIKAINDTLNEQKLIIEIRNESLNLQNEKILAQKDLLAKQNKDINESILYAKQIQTATIPKRNLLDKLLPENFIFFKPRDVVSGDFYWIRKIKHYLILVVADCTGHGVPGAFMSMLGISILNEVVRNREITKANEALNELRSHVKQALEQTGKEGEVDDGMDLALCVLDTETNVLQYAGANNSLYLIIDGNFRQIKADKMPVGYYPNEKPSFTNHELKLKKGDTIYLFTDGFMDQFGGKKGFKYMVANFQQFLLEISIRPMDVQETLLEQELEEWMNGWEQTDDILVMGVRV